LPKGKTLCKRGGGGGIRSCKDKLFVEGPRTDKKVVTERRAVWGLQGSIPFLDKSTAGTEKKRKTRKGGYLQGRWQEGGKEPHSSQKKLFRGKAKKIRRGLKRRGTHKRGKKGDKREKIIWVDKTCQEKR